MTSKANEKTQKTLKDPENVKACLLAVKAKPDLTLLGFTAFASTGPVKEARSLLAEASVTNPDETQLAMKFATLQTWFSLYIEFTATRQRMLA